MYFTVAAALYDHVRVVAVVGEDFPQAHLEYLSSLDADTQALEVIPGTTFRWGARYELDMNTRETLFTDLGVFADFQPSVPREFGDSEIVFLANIHPALQLDVLDQTQAAAANGGPAARLVAMDTMNLWISQTRDTVTEVFRRVDIVLISEEEARQYAGTPSLRAAAEQILSLGPRWLVVKQGSYGAVLFGADGGYFAAPAYPLQEVRDPTGAGDAFAGGFLGYLSLLLRSGEQLRVSDYGRALVHGNILGAFACEDFSVDRLRPIVQTDIQRRYGKLVQFTHFEPTWEDEGAPSPAFVDAAVARPLA